GLNIGRGVDQWKAVFSNLFAKTFRERPHEGMLELKGIRLQPLDQTDEVPERGLVGCCLAAGQDISDQSEGAFLRGSSNQRDVIWPHEIGSVVVWIEDAGVDVVDADAVIEGLERGNAAL